MQKKKGISLIVLVITIIVMIILAGAIILTLNNSGIIEKASEAVDITNEATIKELAQLGWAEAYTEYGADLKKLDEGVRTALTKNNINPDEYKITVTTSGVKIKLLANMWIKEGFTVRKGNQVLEIGDTVNYTATGTTYNGGWKVLGADEDGNLLIMSATDIQSNIKLGAENLEEAQQDWLYGIDTLDSICKVYGNGEGAIGSRSITVEDIDSVTGYDKTTYGVGQVYQYGNIVKYIYNGTTAPSFKSSVIDGSLSTGHGKGFFFYNDKDFVIIDDLLSTEKQGEVFATLKSNAYEYSVSNLSTINKTDNDKAYSMLFGENEELDYWLSSKFVGTRNGYAFYGMFCIKTGKVTKCNMWYSHGYYDSLKCGVRAVVVISSQTNII